MYDVSEQAPKLGPAAPFVTPLTTTTSTAGGAYFRLTSNKQTDIRQTKLSRAERITGYQSVLELWCSALEAV
jgi:hypothetical protein